MEQRDGESMRGPSNTPAGQQGHGPPRLRPPGFPACPRHQSRLRLRSVWAASAAGPPIARPKNIGPPRSRWVGGILMPTPNRSGITSNTCGSRESVSSESPSWRMCRLEPCGGCSATHRTRQRRPTALAPKRRGVCLPSPLTTQDGSPRRLVAADETRERIDALTAAGHSLTELARLIGKPRTSLRRSLSRQSVTAETATSVEALYRTLAQARPTGPQIPRTVRHFGETPSVRCHLGPSCTSSKARLALGRVH